MIYADLYNVHATYTFQMHCLSNYCLQARHYIKAIQDSHGKVELEEDDQELTYAVSIITGEGKICTATSQSSPPPSLFFFPDRKQLITSVSLLSIVGVHPLSHGAG